MKSKRCVLWVVIVLVLFGVMGCSSGKETINETANKKNDKTLARKDNKKSVEDKEDVVILYTNDIHCAVEGTIGYAGLMAYKKEVEKRAKFVSLVDLGDTLYGSEVETKYEGEYITEIMNKVGVDVAALGNHDIDGGMSTLQGLIKKSNAEYIGCNVSYIGNKEDRLTDVKPYIIKEYGDVSVAYIGVTTPRTKLLDKERNLYEDGKCVYDFKGDSTDKEDNGEEFYKCVKGYVEECKSKGADYVVVLAHLGDKDGHAPFSSPKLAENVPGIDVILDAHAHSVIPCMIKENSEGENVLISSTGSMFENIGQLVITSKGNISTGLISSYDKKDKEMETYIEELKVKYK